MSLKFYRKTVIIDSVLRFSFSMKAPEVKEPMFFGMGSLAQFYLAVFEVNDKDLTSGRVIRALSM